MLAPRMVRVASVRAESARHATLGFDDSELASYRPGQFVMVWVPGVDEVPMALWDEGGRYQLTVEAKGDATRALCGLSVGDAMGIRGPYGRSFAVEGDRILLVGGGTGTVPLVPFARQATRQGARVGAVVGARSAEFVLLDRQLKASGATVEVATDDGTRGFHGRAHELVKRRLAGQEWDAVVTCGPELMMRAVLEVAQEAGVSGQASVERWMKCAVGICDACLLDGFRVCRDGPVFAADQLLSSKDFGCAERGPDGKRSRVHGLGT